MVSRDRQVSAGMSGSVGEIPAGIDEAVSEESRKMSIRRKYSAFSQDEGTGHQLTTTSIEYKPSCSPFPGLPSWSLTLEGQDLRGWKKQPDHRAFPRMTSHLPQA